MPTLNNVAPSGKPSLFGLNPDSAAADTAVNNRVLAHLEGRKSSSSATAKYLGAGVLATAVLGAAGFYAWQKRTTPDESTVIAQAPAAPAVQPVPATPAAALTPTAAPAPEPSPQTARIVNDALPQAAPVDAKKSEQSPGQQDMAAGSAAPAHHATSTAARRAEAKASSSHKEKDKERAKADGIVTAKAAKSAAKSKANSAQSQKPPAESDPDADLLTFLLQMRDPRKSPDTK